MLRPGDLVISHPAHWALVARHAGHLPIGMLGVTSTAPCPDELVRRLAALGLVSLTQVYGSSETAGIGTRTAAGAGFRLMPFWSRVPAHQHRLCPVAPDGSTLLHVSQDRLTWTRDGEFTVCGRIDDAVQVGGVNVSPAHVRGVLLAHPQIADALVRLMQPEEGLRLKAFVAPALGTDTAGVKQALWPWTAARLTTPERPKAFTFGDKIPCNAMDKLADWPLVPSRLLPRAASRLSTTSATSEAV